MSNDETLSTFIAVTGCDGSKAEEYLKSTDWNLENAVNLFLAAGPDTSASATGAGSAGTSGGSSAASTGTGDAGLGVMGRGVGGGGGGGGVQEDSYMAEHGVRAPIAPKRATLQDDMAPGLSGLGMHFGFQMGGLHQPPRRFGPGAHGPHQTATGTGASAFDPFADYSRAAGDGDDEAEVIDLTGTQKKLADLYKPPTDIMYKGTFDEAKYRGSTDGKWLLVNIQKIDEFDSQRLNRDTWSHQMVQEIVKSAFVFWQVYHDSPEANYFTTYYPATEYPVIAIIDPRTGARKKSWTGFQDPADLLDKLGSFLGDNDISQLGVSIAPAANNANTARSSATTTTTTTASSDQPTKRFKPSDAMTEDEQIAAAIAASLEQPGAGAGTSGSSPHVTSMDTTADTTASTTTTTTTTATPAASAAAVPAPAGYTPVPTPTLPEEPAAGTPETTRLQFRLPDGSRAVRRFRIKDPVSILYDFAVHKVEEAQSGRPFTLLMMDTAKGSPLEDKEQTLVDAGCKNTAVMVRWDD
eukprot:TRINITY_DN330_c0_g2_i3.p1 TRINITY_DN330_c0_g2~~TRINITY_DN330_c0_g2_i3.p1  ORF type:complete len:524 (-),score=128.25 TRINITY_DN330_c0_g2_i3:139-1710(-)